MGLNYLAEETERPTIPDGWDVATLGDLFVFANGVNAEKSAYGSGIRFINVLEPIMFSHLRGSEIPGRIEIPSSVAASYAVRRGDVVFNRTSETDSELGLAAVYIGDEDVVFGGFVIRGRPIGDRVDAAYSGYALRSAMIRSQIMPMGQGAVRANISQDSLRKVVVALPPKEEQRAIAEALSDVDALLDALGRLIAKKRDIKQAVMQQLLTGRTRLPGFGKPWMLTRLGDHTRFLRNGAYPRAALSNESSIKYLHYGDIHTSATTSLNVHVAEMPRLNTTLAKGLERLEDGDVVFVDASEDVDGIGKSVEITETHDQQVVAGLHTIAARFDKNILADGFKAYLQFIPAFRAQLTRLAAGTKVYATTRAHIASIEFELPSLPEQRAIATVLSDMDAELSALEARRAKTVALKQAMMQELLTGRTRLV